MLANERRLGQVFSRVIFPLILFLAVVGGIAFVTQYMPSRVKPQADPAKPGPETAPAAAALLQFEHGIDAYRAAAVWDPKDTTYIAEFEREKDGKFDYPFRNVSDQPVQIGLQFSNCDCSRVELAVFTPEEWKQYQADSSSKSEPKWNALDRSDAKGVLVPKGSHGVARVKWNSKKQEGQGLQLAFKLWAHPEGQSSQRQSFDALTPIKIVSAFMFEPAELRVGLVTSQATSTLLCYSATREDSQLLVDESKLSPCYSCKLEPLGESERTELEQKWRKDEKNPRNTRLKSAYRLHVTVLEEKDGKYLDQGHFRQVIPLVLKAKDTKEEIPGPVIGGVVRGDLLVGGPEDDGKVQLKSFPANEGVQRVVPVTVDAGTHLEVVTFAPTFLKVDLKPREKNSKSSRAVWNLSVEVPKSSMFGPFPEDAVIILRSKGAQTRLIRVPIQGNGVQG